MFDELKKSKVTEFKSCNVKCLKEIKRLKSLQKPEAYLEPKTISTMELSLWIFLKAYYFCNKSSVIMFNWVIYRPPKILKFWSEIRWNKSSWLLQRVTFLILFSIFHFFFFSLFVFFVKFKLILYLVLQCGMAV